MIRPTARSCRHQGASSIRGVRLRRTGAALLLTAALGAVDADGLALVVGPFIVGPAAAAEQSVTRATQQLFEAVHSNDLAAARASVAAGADLEAMDRWGLTALELAIDKGYYEIAHFLTAARSARRSWLRPPSQPAAAGRSALPARSS